MGRKRKYGTVAEAKAANAAQKKAWRERQKAAKTDDSACPLVDVAHEHASVDDEVDTE